MLKNHNKDKKPTKKQRVRDYIEWFGRKPFSYHDVVSHTGIDYDVVRCIVCKFVKENLVKLVRLEGRRRFYVKVMIPENKGSPEIIKKRQIINMPDKHKRLYDTTISNLLNQMYLAEDYRQLCELPINILKNHLENPFKEKVILMKQRRYKINQKRVKPENENNLIPVEKARKILLHTINSSGLNEDVIYNKMNELGYGISFDGLESSEIFNLYYLLLGKHHFLDKNRFSSSPSFESMLSKKAKIIWKLSLKYGICKDKLNKVIKSKFNKTHLNHLTHRELDKLKEIFRKYDNQLKQALKAPVPLSQIMR